MVIYMCDRRKNKGFTLAELLIVIAIMGILCALGFVAVIQHQRNLKLTEADNIAREIYEGAQNHLTAAEASGAWQNKYASYSGSTEVDTKNKESYYGDAFNQSQDKTYTVSSRGPHDFRTITINASNAQAELTGTALETMLPIGSIDETVRSGGTYVIEYDAATVQVYGVFYTEDQNFDTADVAKIDEENGRTDRDYRKLYQDDKKKYAVGYYGGADAEKASASDKTAAELQAPEVEIINGSRLYLKVTYTDNFDALNKLSDNGKYSVLENINIYDSNGNKNEYVINQAVSDVNSTGKAVSTYKSGKKVSQYFILDSIVDGTNYHFSNQFPELTGRNITAQVTLTFAQKSKYEQTKTGKCKKTHSSLYADGTDVNVIGTNTTVTRAKVSNARHLENLSYEMNSTKQKDNGTRKELTVNKAVILNDIDWQAFFASIERENGEYNLIRSKITDEGSNTVYLATGNYSKKNTYFGIVSSTLTDVRSATGTVTLSNFSISPSAATITDSKAQRTAMSSQEVSNNAGLFSALTNPDTITVRNLILKNFTLTGCATGSSFNDYRMGTLFGAVYNNKYLIDNITVSNFDIEEYGTHAGGLIGLVDATPTVNLKSIQINAGIINYPIYNLTFTNDSARNFQQCGGMIGTVNSDNKSTASNTTVTIEKSSIKDVNLKANCLQSGGVIGAANKTSNVTIENVKVENLHAGRDSKSSGTQQFSGGFIGIVNGEKGIDPNKDHAVVEIKSSEINNSELSAGYRSEGKNLLTKQGGIIGCASGYSDITVSETKVTNTVIAGKGAENGGMIGEVSSSSTIKISSSDVQYSVDKSHFIGNEIGKNNYAENTAGGMIALINGAKSVTIENSNVYSDNSGISSYSGSAGGIIGQLDSGNVTINNSYASVGFIRDRRHVYNDATAGTTYGVGGIAGKVSGVLNVSNSYVAGRTSNGKYAEKGDFNKNVFAAGGDAAGGFIGVVTGTGTATVSNSYTTASVYANAGVNSVGTNATLGVEDSAAGGFIGKNTGSVTLNGGPNGVVYCTGLVTADDGINKGAFIGVQSGSATYNNCYALSGINDTSLKLIGNSENEVNGLQYGIKNKEDDTKSSEAFKFNNTSAEPCDESLKSPYAYRGIGMRHVGDWPIPEESKEDVMLVYYEKIRNSDGNIVWRYHGYSEKFANGKTGTGDFSRDDETNYNATEISSNGDGSNPFVNESGNYVIEDGYALLVNSSNSMRLNASNILIGHQKEAVDLNELIRENKIIAYDNLRTELGISGDYSAYVLKNPTLIWNNWSVPDGGFYVFKKSSDLDDCNHSVRIAQFFINPYFANDISTKRVDQNTSGEIRSARQLSQLFGLKNNNKFLENVSDKGFTVNQTMDIDFTIDCTEAGEKAKYSSKQYPGDNIKCVYNGLSGSDQKHIIKGISSPFGNSMCKIFENVNIVDAETTSLFGTLQENAKITNVDVTNGTFSKSVVVAGENINGEISNVTLNGVTVNPQSDTTTASTAANGICDDNKGEINNITLINCDIEAGNGIARYNLEGKTISTIRIYNTLFNTSSGADDGNGIVRENAGSISDVKIGKDKNQSGNEHKFTNGNGIVGTNSWNGNISNISIDSYTFDNGNGIAGTNSGTITASSSVTENSGPITISNCIFTNGSGIAGKNEHNIITAANSAAGAFSIHDCTFTNGSGIANQNTGSNATISGTSSSPILISDCTMTNGNGIAAENTSQAKIQYVNLQKISSNNGIVTENTNQAQINNVNLYHLSAGNGGLSLNDSNAVVHDVEIEDAKVGNGDDKAGFAGTNKALIYNVNLKNIISNSNGFVVENWGSIGSSNIINAQIAYTGFVRNNYGQIIDDHIYSDREVYTSDNNKLYYILNKNAVGGAYTDAYNMYDMTTIGLNPLTNQYTSENGEYAIAGFAAGNYVTDKNGQTFIGKINGCSITASIYHTGSVSGFVNVSEGDSSNKAELNDNYANVIIHSSDIAAGFVYRAKYTNINYNSTAGMILGKTSNRVQGYTDKVGFIYFDIYQSSPWQQYSTNSMSNNYSGIWYMATSSYHSGLWAGYNYKDVFSTGGYALANNSNGYLVTETMVNRKYYYYYYYYEKSSAKGYNADSLAATASTGAMGLSAGECKPYYVYVQYVNGNEKNPYPIPHKWKFDQYNPQQLSEPQVYYGDWYTEGYSEQQAITINGVDPNDIVVPSVSSNAKAAGFADSFDAKNEAGSDSAITDAPTTGDSEVEVPEADTADAEATAPSEDVSEK